GRPLPSPPPFPLRLAIPHLARARAAFVAPAHQWRFLLPVRQTQFVRFQAPDFVAQAAGFLELEVGGGFAHPLFQVLDIGAQVVADEVVARLVAGIDQYAVAAGGVGDDVGDAALDRLRSDAVLRVVFA